MTYTTTQLTAMLGVTERALRHYEQIGLIAPARNAANNYREYTDSDVRRLSVIGLMKRLGLSLEEIKARIDSAYFDIAQYLEDAEGKLASEREQLETLISQAASYRTNVDGLQAQVEAHKLAGLDDDVAADRATEAYVRWGSSDAYAKSTKRTAHYQKGDWQQVKADGLRIAKRFAEVMDQDPASAKVQAVVQEYIAYLSQFYDPTPEILAGLADMYESDPRFKQYYEDIALELAKFVSSALRESLGKVDKSA